MVVTVMVTVVMPLAATADVNWQPTTGPEGEGKFICFAIDPANSQVFYTGIFDGVYKTTNGGATWKVANTGMERITIGSITIDPNYSNVLYATDDTGNGVFKTIDGGGTWCPSGNKYCNDGGSRYKVSRSTSINFCFTHIYR